LIRYILGVIYKRSFHFIIILAVALQLSGCSTSKLSGTKTIYFKKFDLFTLSGSDTIPAPKIEKKLNPEFVSVIYKNEIPQTITYHYMQREVILKLDSIFKINGQNIYVYATGNLLGGKSGRQREYAFHYINNGYKLFINLSDTLLVKSYDNDAIKRGNSYHYMVDVYLKKKEQYNKYYLFQGDVEKSTGDDTLYNYWLDKLKVTTPEVISNVIAFPPR
jgi:hypothetical protein